MSPTYREPSKSDAPSRSLWSTTSIFLALGFLTFLMGLLVYSAIQSVGTSPSDRAGEIRAAR